MGSRLGAIEAVVQRCSVKKVFLEISRNSQENTCARVSLLQAAPAALLKKRLWHSCFPVNSAKFLRTPLFTEHLWWLLLELHLQMFFFIIMKKISFRVVLLNLNLLSIDIILMIHFYFFARNITWENSEII